MLLLSLCLSPAALAEGGRGSAPPAAAPLAASQGRASPSARLVGAIADIAAAGDWKSAASALEDARLALPDNADILYLSALVSLKLNGEVHPALSWLQAGLVSGRFELYSAQDAGDLAASLLIRLRRYEEALGLLSSLPEAVQPSRGLDPEYRRLRAQAFLGLGKRPSAVSELRAGAERFPADPRFARLFFERFAAAPLPAERDLADLFLGRLGLLAAQDPELPLIALPFMVLPADRENAVRAARALGIKSARASLLGLEYGLIGDEAAVKEFFAGPAGSAAGRADGEADGDSRIDLANLASLSGLIGTDSGRAAFAAALSGFSGIICADRDGDGFIEEESRYGSGLLSAWSLDSDQDGRPELSLACREGLPVSCALRRPGTALDIEYSHYPYVSHIAFWDGTGRGGGDRAVSYRFGPEALPFAPLGLRPFPDAKDSAIFLAGPQAAALPTERAAAGAALETDYREGEILNVVSLDRGLPLRREAFQAGKILSVTLYEKGLPKREMRDSDGDGRFETEISYLAAPRPADPTASPGPAVPEGPARTVARVDADGDGIFEYSEADFPPFRKEWDLDRNGSADVVQLSVETGPAAGGSRREFSSRLDGRFDEVLVCDSGGRIISFTRDGKALALVQDSNPALRWIGAKPFDLGSNLASASGVYNYMNARYRLVVLPSGSFAEVLP
jgi:hypothetical protein